MVQVANSKGGGILSHPARELHRGDLPLPCTAFFARPLTARAAMIPCRWFLPLLCVLLSACGPDAGPRQEQDAGTPPRNKQADLAAPPTTSEVAENGARVALVIGCGKYAKLSEGSQLTSPVLDAADVASALAKLGYTIVTGGPVTDAGREAFLTATEKFAAQARGASSAVFYFSGHGVQVADDNYLLPSDTPKLSGTSVLKNRAVLLRDSVMVALEEAGAKNKIIILDCCRDNPFSAELDAALATVGKGTQSTSVGEISGYGPGFYLAFATSPGFTALDGNGQRNSPFTAAVLKLLPDAAEKDIDFFFREVKASLGDEQVSWTSHSLRSSFSLPTGRMLPPKKDTAPVMSEAEVQRRVQEELAMLQSLQASLESGSDDPAQEPSQRPEDPTAQESKEEHMAQRSRLMAASPELRKINREISFSLAKELDNLYLEIEGLQSQDSEMEKECALLVAELKARKAPPSALDPFHAVARDPKIIDEQQQKAGEDLQKARQELAQVLENPDGAQDIASLARQISQRRKQRDARKVSMEARLTSMDQLKELLDRTLAAPAGTR